LCIFWDVCAEIIKKSAQVSSPSLFLRYPHSEKFGQTHITHRGEQMATFQLISVYLSVCVCPFLTCTLYCQLSFHPSIYLRHPLWCTFDLLSLFSPSFFFFLLSPLSLSASFSRPHFLIWYVYIRAPSLCLSDFSMPLFVLY